MEKSSAINKAQLIWSMLALMGLLTLFSQSVLATTAKAKPRKPKQAVTSKAPVLKQAGPSAAVKPKSRILQPLLLAQNSSDELSLDNEITLEEATAPKASVVQPYSAVASESVGAKDLEVSGQLTISTAGSINNAEKKSYSGSYTLDVSAAHKPSNISGGIEVGYLREYTYEMDDGHDGDWDYPGARIRKKFVVSGIIDEVNAGLAGTIGMGREARRQTFRYSLGPTLNVKKTWGRFSLTQSASYARRFFEYDIRDDGTVNSPDLFSLGTSAGFEMSKKFSLSASFAYQYLISFQQVGRGSTSVIVGADYAVTGNLGISTGFATLKNALLEPDGRTTRVTVWDPNATVAFFDLILSL